MLKISEEKPGSEATTLRLEGRIVGPWVDELRRVCESLAGTGSRLSLNLDEVTFADDSAILLLVELQDRGIRLLQMTPLLEQQMKVIMTRPAA